jgi:hypothetical protein
MLTRELVEHFGGPVSIVVGTRDARLRPGFTRVFGIVGDVGSPRITFFAPEVTSQRMLADLGDNGQVAVQVTSWATFMSYQIKGTVREIVPAGPEAERVIAHVRDQVVVVTAAAIGEPFSQRWAKYVTMPALAITFEAREVYLQTPGPRAGARIG